MPPAVAARNVGKTYRQHRRFAGFRGAVRTLLTREFTEVRAVEDVSFTVEPGEAVGHLGPNGAGKSTMIKMLTGIMVPSSGTVSVLGRDPHRSRMANAREIGVVFGQRSQLWWDLPVIDSFRPHRAIYRIDDGRFRRNFDEFAGLLDLAPLLDRPVRQLSLGQRMRCEVVMIGRSHGEQRRRRGRRLRARRGQLPHSRRVARGAVPESRGPRPPEPGRRRDERAAPPARVHSSTAAMSRAERSRSIPPNSGRGASSSRTRSTVTTPHFE